MAWYNFSSGNKGKQKVKGFAEQDNSGAWLQYFNQYLQSQNGKLLTFEESNPYELACNIAELFIPIDAIADRAASVPYEIVDANDNVIEPKGNLKRLLERPNPFDRFSDIVYKSVFSELADGNSYIYTKSSLKFPTYDNIANLWVLHPNKTEPKFLKQISDPFLMKDKKDFIAFYRTFFMYVHDIEPKYILHTTALGLDEKGKGRSPLIRVNRNINNILAVYHARYNVYAKNGMGGILSAAPNGKSSIEQAVDPVTRDAMLEDILDRKGLTGDKNFLAMSAVPMQFIKTLGTIAELQPFEETEANAIAIAGIYGVNKELIPRSGSTTFTNQKDAEKGLWQNVVKGICIDKGNDIAKALFLPDGWTLRPNFDNVEALQEDKKTALEADAILIDNLAKLREAEQDVSQAYANLVDGYNGDE